MAKTKIKRDSLGLYAICGGYISRPFYGTSFNEGDEVKTHHFGGSTMAGVTSPDKPETHNFKRSGQYEIWTTTGISSLGYQKQQIPDKEIYAHYKTFNDYLVGMTEWYKNYVSFGAPLYTKKNQSFTK